MESGFVPTQFDLGFRKALEYLIREGLTTSSDFADKAELNRPTLSEILAGKRGVPRHKVPLVTYILSNTFGVNLEFLNNGKGPYLSKPLPIDERAHPEYASLKKEILLLNKKLDNLEQENKLLKEIKDTQSKLIDSLNDKLIKGAKK